MPENEFRAVVRMEAGIPVVDLSGEVNGFAEHELHSAFTKASSAASGTVLLNFADVVYMNSTGIALIVALLAQARKVHMQLRASGLSEHYKHIFSITRLSDFMTIYDDEASAISNREPAR